MVLYFVWLRNVRHVYRVAYDLYDCVFGCAYDVVLFGIVMCAHFDIVS